MLNGAVSLTGAIFGVGDRNWMPSPVVGLAPSE